MGPSLKDLKHQDGLKRRPDEKGSKSARRVSAKSIGAERSANRNEFSSLKCGKTDRTIKSYRDKHNERECYNDNIDPSSFATNGRNQKEAKIRYQNLGVNSSQQKNDNIREVLKNMKSKEDINAGISPNESIRRVSDQDYSAYLENEHLAHQSSGDDPNACHELRLMPQKDTNKIKQKKNPKMKDFGLKPGIELRNKTNFRNKPYREKNNNSQLNKYEQDNIHSYDISDLSEEYLSSNRNNAMMEDRRRVQTEFDRHPLPNRPYVLNSGRKFQQEILRPSKQNKISSKIKKRRKSEMDFEIDDSFYTKDMLGVDITEDNKVTHYQDDDSSYLIHASSTPDIQEGMPPYSNPI